MGRPSENATGQMMYCVAPNDDAINGCDGVYWLCRTSLLVTGLKKKITGQRSGDIHMCILACTQKAALNASKEFLMLIDILIFSST